MYDTLRVLAPGEMELFHDFNHGGEARHHGMNFHAGNRLWMESFREYAGVTGLKTVDSKKMDWGGINDLYGLTRVRKPRSPCSADALPVT